MVEEILGLVGDLHPNLTEDIITVMIRFLPLDDCLKFIRVSKSWHRAIQSLQNMWRFDVLMGNLRIDQIYSIETIEEEYWKAYPNDSDHGSEVDWLKVVQLQFLKLPKKVAIEKHGVLQILGKESYGNVNLVNSWISPFLTSNTSSKDYYFPPESSIFEFSFKIVEEIEKIQDSLQRKIKLGLIYSCCLFYELLTLGDYVPNLYTDVLSVIPISKTLNLETFTMKESFSFFLLAVLESMNYNNVFLNYFTQRYFEKLKEPNVMLYEITYFDSEVKPSTTTPEMAKLEGIVDLNFCPNIDPVKFWLLLHLFQATMSGIEINDDWKNEESKLNSYSLGCLFPLYRNAGGYWNDILKVSFCLDPLNGKRIKLTRYESKEFY